MKLTKYMSHNLILLLVILASFVLYNLFSSFLLKTTSVGVALSFFVVLNALHHKQMGRLTKGIFLEYFLIALLVFLIYLFVTLY